MSETFTPSRGPAAWFARACWGVLRGLHRLRRDTPPPAFRVISLGRPERLALIARNQRHYPGLELFPGINGYDPAVVNQALKDSGLQYHSLDFPTYGTLACFLAKHAALRLQVRERIPLMVLLEDDVALSPAFGDYVGTASQLLFLFPWLNHLRLGRWGEGYLTTPAGAARILRRMAATGIIRNVDNQLALDCGPKFPVERLITTPWTLEVATNQGDCLKTAALRPEALAVS